MYLENVLLISIFIAENHICSRVLAEGRAVAEVGAEAQGVGSDGLVEVDFGLILVDDPVELEHQLQQVMVGSRVAL